MCAGRSNRPSRVDFFVAVLSLSSPDHFVLFQVHHGRARCRRINGSSKDVSSTLASGALLDRKRGQESPRRDARSLVLARDYTVLQYAVVSFWSGDCVVNAKRYVLLHAHESIPRSHGPRCLCASPLSAPGPPTIFARYLFAFIASAGPMCDAGCLVEFEKQFAEWGRTFAVACRRYVGAMDRGTLAHDRQ